MAARVCVVGAGPAGIIQTAALLQPGRAAARHVTWVDSGPGFDSAGRLGRFAGVNANTKVELVASWFEQGPLNEIARGCPASEAAVAAIRQSAAPSRFPDHGDPNQGWCMLGVVVDALSRISERLRSR